MNKHTILIFSLLFFAAAPLFAQAAPPASTPISGLEIALAGGVAYGVKKFLDARKNR
jgi:hypothetical protein